MIRSIIWIYILGGVFSSAIFLREGYQDFANLAVGILLLVSALVVYNKRNEIEGWINGKNKKD